MNKQYWSVLAFDAVWMSLAYAWLAHNIEQAGKVFLLFMWFTGVVAVISRLTMNKTQFKVSRPKYFYPWHLFTDLIIVSICAWTGHFVLAGVYLFGHFAAEAARECEPKEKKD